jgi:hypothetical protein
MKGIIKADDRLKVVPKVNIVMFGPSGVGKTTQARTLDPNDTLFIDLEAGTLAIQDWAGDVVDVRKQASALGIHPWEYCRALTLFICGPAPSDPNGPYGIETYKRLCAHEAFGDVAAIAKYKNLYVDSITVASRLAFEWVNFKQEEAVKTDRNAKIDKRGAYGTLKQELIRWLTHLQHSDRSTILVGILDKEKDDFGRDVYTPQIEGAATARELPGIFDQVLTLQTFKAEDGTMHRAFVCRQDNQWGYPAKDRSGRLETIEAPDLGLLMKKIREGKRLDTTLITSLTAEVSNKPKAETK